MMRRHSLAAAAAISALVITSVASGAKAEGGESTMIPRDEIAAYTIPDESEPAAAPVEAKAAAVEAEPPKTAPRIRGAASELARTEALRALVERYASENSIPFALAHAVVRIESRYNAAARNGPNMGLTQINARTARALGYAGASAGLLDPDTNLRYGLKYLARAYELAKGDTCGAIQRYRGGHRSLTISKATRTYCAKVMTITASAQ